MTEDPTVLTVGHINWDVVLQCEEMPEPDHSDEIESEYKDPGGSATNTAFVLSSLGIETHLCGSLGDDEYGDRIQRILSDCNITPHTTAAEPTTVIYAFSTENADPRYLAKDQQVGDFDVDTVPDRVWDELDHMHITSFSDSVSKRFVEKAVAEDVTISFNPSQGYENTELSHIVDAADLLFLNDREAEIFRQRHNLGKVVDSGATVIITHGGAGCTLYSPTGITTHSGFPSSEVVDTVGAGDSFIAGFLSKWLSDVDQEEALAYANAVGAVSVTYSGAPKNIDLDQVQTVFSE